MAETCILFAFAIAGAFAGVVIVESICRLIKHLQ